MTVWKGIGILVALYTLISVLRGEIHARSGMGMATYYRNTEPRRFWLTAAIYAGLTIALFTVF